VCQKSDYYQGAYCNQLHFDRAAKGYPFIHSKNTVQAQELAAAQVSPRLMVGKLVQMSNF